MFSLTSEVKVYKKCALLELERMGYKLLACSTAVDPLRAGWSIVYRKCVVRLFNQMCFDLPRTLNASFYELLIECFDVPEMRIDFIISISFCHNFTCPMH